MIGIGVISEHGLAKKCIDNIKKYTKTKYKIAVIDNANTIPIDVEEKIHRFNQKENYETVRNKCIALLSGCDLFFIIKDNFYPNTLNWEKAYITRYKSQKWKLNIEGCDIEILDNRIHSALIRVKKVKKQLRSNHPHVLKPINLYEIEKCPKSINNIYFKRHEKLKRVDEEREKKKYDKECLECINDKIKKEIDIVDNNIYNISKEVSVIIPAYKAQNFIEECLDSIDNQTYFKRNKYEILLGIDGCPITLRKVYEIKHKYQNLKIFAMNSNKGTYVTLNTLLANVKYNNIVIFNADDVMKPCMVNEISKHFKHDIVQFYYDRVNEEGEYLSTYKCGANGVIYIQNELVKKLGGFRDWICAGDYELLERSSSISNKFLIEKPLFKWRKHDNSLTSSAKTSMSSKIRQEYHKKISNKFKYIKPIINDFYIIKNDALPLSISKKNFSIIIPAYKAQDFIEECLDSIDNQIYFNNNDGDYEILLGIDGCDETLKKVNKIRSKYKNLYVYVMKSNMGTYVTINTLMTKVKYNNVIIFNADDIMKLNLVDEISDYTEDYDIVRFSFDKKFFDDSVKPGRNSAKGVLFIKKDFYRKMGGYRDWKCAGDHEFLERASSKANVKILKERLFYYRIYNDSLTKSSDTGLKSDLRKEYHKKISNKFEYIEPVINDDCYLLNNLNMKNKINIIITAYKSVEFIEECLDSVSAQTYFKKTNNYSILLGIDGCIETLEKVKKIKYNYKNLKVFYSETNNGTYVTMNSLIDKVRDDEFVLRFDSDDIMYNDMVEKLMKNEDIKICRYDGIIFIKKKIFKLVGGYRDWRCAADTDLLSRLKFLKYKITKTPIYYERRYHSKQLTQRPGTGLGSILRTEYEDIINKNKKSINPEIYIEPKTVPMIEI